MRSNSIDADDGLTNLRDAAAVDVPGAGADTCAMGVLVFVDVVSGRRRDALAGRRCAAVRGGGLDSCENRCCWCCGCW